MSVGTSVPGYPEIIDVRGYDPLRHNLFGLDTLHQDERWLDKAGTEHRLDDMPPSYRRHLLAFLRRRAFGLAFRDSIAALSSPLAPRGDMACDAMDHALDWQMAHPAEWLENTPLVKRLASLVAQDERIQAELLDEEMF